MKEYGFYEKSTDYYGIEDYDDFSGSETEKTENNSSTKESYYRDDVILTNDLEGNKEINSLLAVASGNKVFRNVMASFYKNQNHVYIHLAQLKDELGNPSGHINAARTESYLSPNNPVGKQGIHRIIINKDLLSSDGSLNVDRTFVFGALLHEDFLKRGGEAHHNQMGAFNRKELIEGMKEFDNQLKEAGETVPEYHKENWYEAMSWYGLRRTQVWQNFQKENPEKAEEYSQLISEQIERNEKAINGK